MSSFAITVEGVMAAGVPLGSSLPIKEGLAIYNAFREVGRVALYTAEHDREKAVYFLKTNSILGYSALFTGQDVPPRSQQHTLFITGNALAVKERIAKGESALLFIRSLGFPVPHGPRSWDEINEAVEAGYKDGPAVH